MKKNFLCGLALFSSILLTACSSNVTELYDGVKVTGDAYISDDCKAIFHFSTRTPGSQIISSDIIDNARVETQFICCNDKGDIINSFSVNRENINRTIVPVNNETIMSYCDFSLSYTKKGVVFVDDSEGLSLPSMTLCGASISEYIEQNDTAYYLWNLGGAANNDVYTTILRFVNANGSYDLYIPYSVAYLAYDQIQNQFIYRLVQPTDEFKYGIIDYNPETCRYCYNEPDNSVSLKTMIEEYGNDVSEGFRILFEDNIVYEMFSVPLNNKILNDLGLPSDYLNSSQTSEDEAVILLRTIDIKNGTASIEYLTTEPYKYLKGYPLMSGTQQMPVTAVNGKLYFFSGDEKMNIYSPETGFSQYDISFDSTGALNAYSLFSNDSKAGDTLADFSPVRVCDDGNVYTAHIYSDGMAKIHKYNFENECFELYWSSNENFLDEVNKKSLKLISFEVMN